MLCVVCRLVNTIKPGSVPKINNPATMPFKKMENIANYLKGVRALGMKEFEMFGTPDLFEEKNIAQVSASQRSRYETVVFEVAHSKCLDCGGVFIQCVCQHDHHYPYLFALQVSKSIHALGRLLQTIMPAFTPKLGVKVVEKNERHFSEDQMRQARAAVSVLNLGSSDMAKKATASLLEGKDSQAFLGKPGAARPPAPARPA